MSNKKPKTLSRKLYEKFSINNGIPSKPRKVHKDSPEARAAKARKEADWKHFEDKLLEEQKEVWE